VRDVHVIYLDYQASTPVDPTVLEAMLPYLAARFGNASSVQHEAGRQAASAIEQARRQVARFIGAHPHDIVFTSGATEANNLAIGGVAAARGGPGHIVSSRTEHPSVLEPLAALERCGWEVTYLDVDRNGEISLADLEEAIRDDTALVSLMLANNELGTVHPVADIAAIARRCGALVHTDAVQAASTLPIDVNALHVDLVSLSGHKLYGPQGVGALYVRWSKRFAVSPMVRGGGQEGGLRSGTPNTPGIVGLGAACEIASTNAAADAVQLARQRDRLSELIADAYPDASVNGPPADRRLPSSLHVTLPGAEADAVMANCPDLAVAAGSACSSAAPGPSHVLTAIGIPPELAECSLRLSVGRFTTDAEVEAAARQLCEAALRVARLTAPSAASAGMPVS
jgi:cysteine desulfurase